ncbi:glutamate synthase subunit beta [Haliscomenobacter hydrossis]|uniref:Glutamate synthase, NADH/NADPH, small subunit n=1 Tax=Haliscomenobacter hydrossis (strain ATCC 27775 / DSM 1100 / LMG 10767 / O) TaxID=760192 RepID=F4KSX2_HALH1|nr:glutamate synthase subunit beta [Haliscomenobacter hydrossis]AEE49079.1 glutamate synthase, NADH/NADPH, small subunit [Haliscomenobacter hydrossis DSM 1100]
MADPKGFLKHTRELPSSRKPEERINDYREIYEAFSSEKTVDQASRCMDCGVPFCHSGCPLGNIIPEFNDAVYQENWDEAYQILSSTNNFPEFTGRICPAPCEAACVLGINQPPVAIEHIEKSIAELAFEKGYVVPQVPAKRTGKKVAVIGSGPAGLGAAAQLNKAGHLVTVFERKDRVGGLLRYGIPDFKLEKWVIDRRVKVMEQEGIKFSVSTNIGVDIEAKQLLSDFDAVVLAGGSTIPRDLPIPGRELKGVHFAMDFLEPSNRRQAGDQLPTAEDIWATGKHVVVIGGGDTGADCVGTSNRHRAASITQIELLAKPPKERDEYSWPNWPMILRTSSSHEEGADRQWAIQTKRFIGDEQGNVKQLELVKVEWAMDQTTGRYSFKEVAGSEQIIPCDLALLAIGFVHPQHQGMLEQLGVELDERGNVKATEQKYQSSNKKVFAAGDMRRGQSLVVWAISEGRECARQVDLFLMGHSILEAKEDSPLMLHEIEE